MSLWENRDGLRDRIDSELANIIIVALQGAKSLRWYPRGASHKLKKPGFVFFIKIVNDNLPEPFDYLVRCTFPFVVPGVLCVSFPILDINFWEATQKQLKFLEIEYRK